MIKPVTFPARGFEVTIDGRTELVLMDAGEELSAAKDRATVLRHRMFLEAVNALSARITSTRPRLASDNRLAVPTPPRGALRLVTLS